MGCARSGTLLLVACLLAVDLGHAARVGRFAWLSDPHVDPWYGVQGQACGTPINETAKNKYGTMGCDPPQALFENQAEAASQTLDELTRRDRSRRNNFVLHTGDFVRHLQDKMPDPYNNVTSIMHESVSTLAKYFKHVVDTKRVVAGPTGNNDSPENYFLNITDSDRQGRNRWLLNVARTFSSAGGMQNREAKVYARGGYFERPMSRKVQLLSINTIIYSVKHSPDSSNVTDPLNQFEWLEETLERSCRRGKAVWIVGHIPPGIDDFKAGGNLWHPQYLESYLKIVQKEEYAQCIAAQLFGHQHEDTFRVVPGNLEEQNKMGPIIIIGAASVVYNNNPSFKIVEYDLDTGRLLDLKTYYAELPKGDTAPEWNFGYSMRQTFPSLRVSKEHGLHGFGDLVADLAKGGHSWDAYTTWYKTKVQNQNSPSVCDDTCRGNHLCRLPLVNYTTYLDTCPFPYKSMQMQKPTL